MPEMQEHEGQAGDYPISDKDIKKELKEDCVLLRLLLMNTVYMRFKEGILRP